MDTPIVLPVEAPLSDAELEELEKLATAFDQSGEQVDQWRSVLRLIHEIKGIRLYGLILQEGGQSEVQELKEKIEGLERALHLQEGLVKDMADKELGKVDLGPTVDALSVDDLFEMGKKRESGQ